MGILEKHNEWNWGFAARKLCSTRNPSCKCAAKFVEELKCDGEPMKRYYCYGRNEKGNIVRLCSDKTYGHNSSGVMEMLKEELIRNQNQTK
jgi:hypothetical protein